MNCSKFEEKMIDYLDGVLSENEQNEFSKHIKECHSCKELLVEIEQAKDFLLQGKKEIVVPDYFMENIQQKSMESFNKTSRKYFCKKKIVAWFVSIMCALLFGGTVMAVVGVDWWKELSLHIQEEMDENIQLGIGERLNMEVIHNNMKITITDVLADDLQTFVYYEIEDLSKANQYKIIFNEGIEIGNQTDIWNEPFQSFPITSHLGLFSDDPNIYKGRLGLLPINDHEAIIDLKFTQLEKVNPLNEENEKIDGEWIFHLPVQKHSAVVKPLNVKTEINGVTIHFHEITFAPTVTTLSYSTSGTSIDSIEFSKIESEDGIYDVDLFTGGYSGHSGTVQFESMFRTQPDSFTVHINSFGKVVEDERFIPFEKDMKEIQFDYLGTNVEVKVIENGNPLLLSVTEELNENRQYERLDFDFLYNSKNVSTGISSNGYYIDKHGNKYHVDEYFFRKNELEQPKLYITDQTVQISSDEDEPLELKGIKINGYHVTEFVNEQIHITVK